MKFYDGLKWGVGAILFVLILLIMPVTLASAVSMDNVPIGFGTDAIGVAQDVVSELVTDEPVQDDGFFVRYDIGMLVGSLTVVFGVWLYRLHPPSSQKTYLQTLDAVTGALRYLEQLPGEKYDKTLLSLIDTLNKLKGKISEPIEPITTQDGIPIIHDR